MLESYKNKYKMTHEPVKVRFMYTLKELKSMAEHIFFVQTGRNVSVEATWDEEYPDLFRFYLDFLDEQAIYEGDIVVDVNAEDEDELTEWLMKEIFGTEHVTAQVGNIEVGKDSAKTPVWFSIPVEEYVHLIGK